MADVYNSKGDFVGSVSDSGEIFDEDDEKVGAVSVKGRVYRNEEFIGNVSNNGEIRGSHGEKLGSINEDGEVFNSIKSKVGDINNSDSVDIMFQGGAALLLLLNKFIIGADGQLYVYEGKSTKPKRLFKDNGEYNIDNSSTPISSKRKSIIIASIVIIAILAIIILLWNEGYI